MEHAKSYDGTRNGCAGKCSGLVDSETVPSSLEDASTSYTVSENRNHDITTKEKQIIDTARDDCAKKKCHQGSKTCPRCSSRDTKFCYYNNHNKNQPRYYCRVCVTIFVFERKIGFAIFFLLHFKYLLEYDKLKVFNFNLQDCERYWTDGGQLRNIRKGSGKRKYKAKTSGENQGSILSENSHGVSESVPAMFFFNRKPAINWTNQIRDMQSFGPCSSKALNSVIMHPDNISNISFTSKKHGNFGEVDEEIYDTGRSPKRMREFRGALKDETEINCPRRNVSFRNFEMTTGNNKMKHTPMLNAGTPIRNADFVYHNLLPHAGPPPRSSIPPPSFMPWNCHVQGQWVPYHPFIRYPVLPMQPNGIVNVSPLWGNMPCAVPAVFIHPSCSGITRQMPPLETPMTVPNANGPLVSDNRNSEERYTTNEANEDASVSERSYNTNESNLESTQE